MLVGSLRKHEDKQIVTASKNLVDTWKRALPTNTNPTQEKTTKQTVKQEIGRNEVSNTEKLDFVKEDKKRKLEDTSPST